MPGADRETRIADLAIHGWEPVVNRGSRRAGIWNEMIGGGFTTRHGFGGVHSINRDVRLNDYEPCPWGEVTDWHLDTIEARLKET